jgi:chromosome segregation ATPase
VSAGWEAVYGQGGYRMYEAALAERDECIRALEAELANWERQGVADQTELNSLRAERDALKARLDEVKDEAAVSMRVDEEHIHKLEARVAELQDIAEGYWLALEVLKKEAPR